MPTFDQVRVSGAFRNGRLELYFRISVLELDGATWSEEDPEKGVRWLGFLPRPFFLFAGGGEVSELSCLTEPAFSCPLTE